MKANHDVERRARRARRKTFVAAMVCAVAVSAQAQQPPAGRGRGNQEPGPTITVQGHKRAVNLVDDAATLDESAADEIRGLELLAFESDDLQEGLAAFAEKRTPDFQGR